MASRSIVYAAVAGVGLGMGVMHFAMSPDKRRRKRKIKTAAKVIQFGSGDGESTLKLPKGAEFIVKYDQTSPWRHIAQPTETTILVKETEGKFRFRVTKQLTMDQPDQVYVQAIDENDQLMGEHKITIFGP